MVEFLVGRQLHEVVVEGDQQFLVDELLEPVRLGLQLVVLVLVGLGEGLDLLVQNDVADVVLGHLRHFDETRHDLQLARAGSLLLELLDHHLQKLFFHVLAGLLVEEGGGQPNNFPRETVGKESYLSQLLRERVLLEDRRD